MPKVTIWIRVEDEEKWKAIDDKPEFIHNALNQEAELEGGMIGSTPAHIKKWGGVDERMKSKPTEDDWEGSNFKK